MKFEFLGTAAAEGWPAMFCGCDACKRAAKSGGRNLRTRSQAVIDDRLLIDFPADTCAHMIFGNLKLDRVHSCIITHSHSDHLYAPDFKMRRKEFATLTEERPFIVYGTGAVGIDVHRIIDRFRLDIQNRVYFTEIIPFVTFETEGYRITPLKANHDALAGSVFYLIEDGEKSILYANDTGWFPEESWTWLESHRIHLDFVSLDCTGGVINSGWREGHMGIDTDHEVAARLKEKGLANESTVICANHFSHNSGAIYDEIVPIAAEKGLLVSYDGMILDI